VMICVRRSRIWSISSSQNLSPALSSSIIAPYAPEAEMIRVVTQSLTTTLSSNDKKNDKICEHYTGIPHFALLTGSRKTALTELHRKVSVQKLKSAS
jgi:hypothetical protein